jgi:hypothetical protein
MPPIVKVERMSLADNRHCGPDGKVWHTANLIERAKTLPIFKCPVAALRTGYSIWNGTDTIQGFAGHMRRVMDADLSHPIIFNADGSLMDGAHRIVKALIEERETIDAVRFEAEPPCDFREEQE